MSRILLLLALVLPLQPAASQARGVVRDSAGVQVVTHAASATAPLYELRSTPVVVGDQVGSELSRVLSAIRMPDEKIVVMDVGRTQLLRFMPSGALDRVLGREGSGPGEFTGPNWMGRYGRDSIAAYDFRQARYSIYADSGFVRQGVLLRSEHMFTTEMRLLGMSPNGTPIIASGGSLQLAAEGPPRVERQVIPIVTYQRDGQPGRLIGNFPGPELEVTRIESGRAAGAFQNSFRLFGVSGAFAIAGRHVVVADTRTFGFDVIDSTGRLIRRVRREVTQQPVQPSHKQAYIAERTAAVREASRARLAAALEKDPHAPVFPAMDATMIVDADGRIWLGSYRRPGDREQTWWILAIDGALLGRVVVPASITIKDAGVNYLLGVTKDEDGVETVRLYDLIRRP